MSGMCVFIYFVCTSAICGERLRGCSARHRRLEIVSLASLHLAYSVFYHYLRPINRVASVFKVCAR